MCGVTERTRERERNCWKLCVRVCVCVCEREGGRGTGDTVSHCWAGAHLCELLMKSYQLNITANTQMFLLCWEKKKRYKKNVLCLYCLLCYWFSVFCRFFRMAWDFQSNEIWCFVSYAWARMQVNICMSFLFSSCFVLQKPVNLGQQWIVHNHVHSSVFSTFFSQWIFDVTKNTKKSSCSLPLRFLLIGNHTTFIILQTWLYPDVFPVYNSAIVMLVLVTVCLFFPPEIPCNGQALFPKCILRLFMVNFMHIHCIMVCGVCWPFHVILTCLLELHPGPLFSFTCTFSLVSVYLAIVVSTSFFFCIWGPYRSVKRLCILHRRCCVRDWKGKILFPDKTCFEAKIR